MADFSDEASNCDILEYIDMRDNLGDFKYAEKLVFDFIKEYGANGSIAKRDLSPLFSTSVGLEYIVGLGMETFCEQSDKLVFERCGGKAKVLIHIVQPEYTMDDFVWWESLYSIFMLAQLWSSIASWCATEPFSKTF